ncbi:hypothetical protein L6250_03165 [Candidatus Parcubacteria bacterium]|nr:hypothetical protein [Patescibacteria group bacterium]MBU4466974.1 hypothetical protein [Patescibacteria group bacterium]MCG2688607.1 hypothetical protein [Candidatus Parcubacteria bacterium]
MAKKKAKNIKFRSSLFWDVDPKTIDFKKHRRYIIERILDFGNDNEARWMWREYPRSLLRKIIEQSRVIRPETRSLWQLLVMKP